MSGIDVQWEEYLSLMVGKSVRKRAGSETQEPSGTSSAEFFRDFIKGEDKDVVTTVENRERELR